MRPANCLNCGRGLLPNQDFCPGCGQKANTSRLTLRQLFYDFLQVFAHAEKGIWRMVRGLAVNPGQTAAEYVEGKRKTYFNPFAFLGLCIAYMILVNSWVKPYDPPLEVDPAVIARITDEEIKRLYLLTVKRTAGFQKMGNANLNIITVLVAPYFGFFLWLFFRYRNRNIAEITVAYILFTGFGTVVTTTLISPVFALVRGHSTSYWIVFSLSLLLQTLYYAWGLKTFLGYKTTGGYLKVFLALSLIGIIGFVLLIAGLFIYVYHDAWEVFRYL